MVKQKNKLKVLFIGKAEDTFSSTAADFIQSHFDNPLIVFSRREDLFPPELYKWKGDLLVSYLAQWIIPTSLLNNAGLAAINFHPGPPEYPGIGCTNFAIYNNENEFGVTCHHMLARVDTGSIIAVKRFPITNNDTVLSVTQRCYAEIVDLFYSLMNQLLANGTLPVSKEVWKRQPYTRKQLNELCLLTPQMSAEEVKRRLKATTFGNKIWAEVLNGEKKMSYETAKAQGIIS